MKKKFTVFLLISLLALVMVGPAWAQEVTAADLLKSLPGNSDKLTRADFVAMLVRAAALEPEQIQSPLQLPTDMRGDAWYAEPVKTALQKGIIKGYSDGTVKPDQEITQLEAASLIVRTLSLPQDMAAPGVTNLAVSNGHWGYNALSWAINEGFVDKDTVPGDKLTRDNGAALLEKVFGSNEKARLLEQKMQRAQQQIKSLRLEGTVDMKMVFDSAVAAKDGMPPEFHATMKMNSDLVISQGMYQKLDMNFSVPAPQNITIEQYLTDQGWFMKMPNPQTGEVMWSKMPGNMFPNITALLKQQANPLPVEMGKYFYYRYLGEENGLSKLAFYGKIEDFGKFMSMLGQGLNSPELDTLTQQSMGLIKSANISGTILVDQNNLPVQEDFVAVVNFNKEFGEQGMPLQSLLAKYHFNIKDYNADMSIVLPQEALNAQEIPMTDEKSDTKTNQ